MSSMAIGPKPITWSRRSPNIRECNRRELGFPSAVQSYNIPQPQTLIPQKYPNTLRPLYHSTLIVAVALIVTLKDPFKWTLILIYNYYINAEPRSVELVPEALRAWKCEPLPRLQRRGEEGRGG